MSIPKTITQALTPEWKQAAMTEFQAHVKNKTFAVVDRPKGDIPILRMHALFGLKYDEHGNIARNKARFVADGSKQTKGENYFETFAPTLTKESLRILLQWTAQHGHQLRQADIETAFLLAPL